MSQEVCRLYTWPNKNKGTWFNYCLDFLGLKQRRFEEKGLFCLSLPVVSVQGGECLETGRRGGIHIVRISLYLRVNRNLVQVMEPRGPAPITHFLQQDSTSQRRPWACNQIHNNGAEMDTSYSKRTNCLWMGRSRGHNTVSLFWGWKRMQWGTKQPIACWRCPGNIFSKHLKLRFWSQTQIFST